MCDVTGVSVVVLKVGVWFYLCADIPLIDVGRHRNSVPGVSVAFDPMTFGAYK